VIAQGIEDDEVSIVGANFNAVVVICVGSLPGGQGAAVTNMVWVYHVMCDFFSSMAIPHLSYLCTQTDRDHHGGITIMYNVAEFVIAIYCLLEDELYPAFCRQHGLPRRAGFPPALSDSECLTVELAGQYLGYTSQKQLYEHMHDRFGAWFPALKDRIGRVGFNGAFFVPSPSAQGPLPAWAIVRPKTNITSALRADCGSPTMA
jgi:hypothetical protein